LLLLNKLSGAKLGKSRELFTRRLFSPNMWIRLLCQQKI